MLVSYPSLDVTVSTAPLSQMTSSYGVLVANQPFLLFRNRQIYSPAKQHKSSTTV